MRPTVLPDGPGRRWARVGLNDSGGGDPFVARTAWLPMPVKLAGLAQLVVQVPLVTESLKVRRTAP